MRGEQWAREGRPTVGEGGHVTFSSFRCDFEDTAQYRVSAMNTQGELSAIASVVVKSKALYFPHYLGFTRPRIPFPGLVKSCFSPSLYNCKLDMQFIQAILKSNSFILGFKGEVDEYLPSPRRKLKFHCVVFW